MNDYSFQFKSPTSYGDWASYAGFNRVTGARDFNPAVEPPPDTTDASGKPIEPPKNLGEYFDRQIQPAKNAFNQLSSAGSQILQGNVMNAYNTMQKPASAFGSNNPPQQPNNDISFGHFLNY
jgi:hypothetical protein